VFDPGEAFDAKLEGSYVYSGPTYSHFGHVMSEMVHRIIPSKRIFAAGQRETAPMQWLFITARGEAAGYESLRPFFKEILNFCEIKADSVTLVNRNTVVERLSICEQGSDFGGGPKPGYLDDVREFSEPRLNKLHGPAEKNAKVYVSRSRLEPRGAMFLGESYIESLLAEEGFTIFYPEEHSFTAQMNVYRKAAVLVFPEGSAIHGTELLGTDMLGQAYMLPRRERHFSIFRKVLEGRAREVHIMDAAPEIGTAIIARGTKSTPNDWAAVSCFDLEALVTFFRTHGLAKLPTLDRQKYFETAESDLRRYIDLHVELKTPFLHPWDVSGLRARLYEALQPSAARRRERLAWRANMDTFVKSSTRSSAELLPHEKLAAAPGTLLTAEFAKPCGDHMLVLGVELDGAALQQPVHYIYRPAWTPD